jgi:hypothetical protein
LIGIIGSLAAEAETEEEVLVLVFLIFRGFDEMKREMEREFDNMFKDIENRAPKDMIREYENPKGGKVREYGPFVYGYSMTVGPDGRPKVREFGNVKSPFSSRGLFTKPLISSERDTIFYSFIHTNQIVHDEMLISKTAVCRTSSIRKENCITQKMECQISRQ